MPQISGYDYHYNLFKYYKSKLDLNRLQQAASETSKFTFILCYPT